MLGQFWMVSGRNRYYTFPKYVRFYGSLQHLWKGHKKILYCEFPGVWNHSASNPGSVTSNQTNPSPIKITACCSTLRTDFHRDHVFQFKQVFRSSGFFSRVNGTKVTVPQLPWSLFPSSSSILQNFVHLCCIGLTSGSTAASYAGSATQYTVCFSLSNPRNVLTTQGSHWFSHTVALFPLAPAASHARPRLFLHPKPF